MKIKAKVDFTHGTMAVMRGDVVNVDEQTARDLEATGLVRIVPGQDTMPDVVPAKNPVRKGKDEGGKGVKPVGAAHNPTRK